MLPWNHFIVAAVVASVVVVLFYPDLDIIDTLIWILAAGIVAALIDMDVILLVRRKAKDDPDLEPWTSPLEVTKDFPEFLQMLHRKGLLSIIKWTHLGSAVVASLVGYLLLPSLFIPMVIGAWSHLATDVPYMFEIGRAASAS